MDRIILIGGVAVGIYFILSGHLDSILGIPGDIIDDVGGVIDTVTHDVTSVFDIPKNILGL